MCIVNRLCVICYEKKNIKIQCKQCKSSKICGKCYPLLLKSNFKNQCPICKYEDIESGVWYKFLININMVYPKAMFSIVNKTEDNGETDCQDEDYENDDKNKYLNINTFCLFLCNVINYIRIIILTLSSILLIYTIGLVILFAYNVDIENTHYILWLPFIVGITVMLFSAILIRYCCVCDDRY